MNEAFREKVNTFCMLNHPAMDKWRQRYDEERHNVEQERGLHTELHVDNILVHPIYSIQHI